MYRISQIVTWRDPSGSLKKAIFFIKSLFLKMLEWKKKKTDKCVSVAYVEICIF